MIAYHSTSRYRSPDTLETVQLNDREVNLNTNQILSFHPSRHRFSKFSPTFPPTKANMADQVTRASNANAHPGMVDRGPPRRSKQEVELEKQAKAAAKVSAERRKAANIQRVAKLESTVKRKTSDMEQQANNPIDAITQPRMKRTKNLPNMVNNSKGTTSDRVGPLTHDTPHRLGPWLERRRTSSWKNSSGCKKTEEEQC